MDPQARHHFVVRLLARHLPTSHVEVPLPNSTLRMDLMIPVATSFQACDVTIVASRPNQASLDTAFRRATLQKQSKYSSFLTRGTFSDFVPFVAGPFGHLSSQALDFLAQHFKEKETFTRVRAFVSFAIARGTAKSILCWTRRSLPPLIT